MTISPTLQRYMADKGIQYDLIPHEPAMTSLGTAHAGHIPRDSMAKGVMLSDGQHYMLAVMPASHHLRMSDLKTELGQELRLASEEEIVEVFRDCDRGAIPPVGSCYGLNVIIENDMDRQHDIYFEGGDHATLVHMKADEFARLNPQAQHGSFSEPMY
ncbi:aminoacyl-tRNA deacylase [Microvirga soli]|uniref:aminoacyl-tRNA deacylase n=1 Tax=Microvirga soli TaxID=1854496 RepID=UPI00191F2790|nr:YbaK/EbsC family protein [Microvirga soli]